MMVKRSQIYKTEQVRLSLQRLVERIVHISQDAKAKARASSTPRSRLNEEGRIGRSITDPFQFGGHGGDGEFRGRDDPSGLLLSEGAFTFLLQDEVVQRCLQELDINLGTDNAGIFRGLRNDGNGQVRLQVLLEMLMKLRGDASKADLVMPAVMVDDLAHDVQEVQEIVARQQRHPRRTTQDMLRQGGAKALGEAG
ncbi:unnamed protein product [Prorocentrum cordatum]|uniref:Uncharacterized protein n=1 Tax=Prorocentrum cordatum TaxID=2364126 RepID=A0ABN9QR18_9DINO|nr:unnamed protein product [Polarella glacialis]